MRAPLVVTLVLALFGAFAAACGADRDATLRVRNVALAPAARFADPDRPRRASELGATLRAEVEAEAPPGETSLVFAFVVDDAVVTASARGFADVETRRPATPDTLYRIASVTKTFTTAAVLALRDAGALGLQDPVSRHLPSLADARYPHGDAAPVTLEQLLTHSAGFPRSGPWAEREPTYRSTASDILSAAGELAEDPGVRASYSNVGFATLGLVVGAVAEEPYRAYVTRKLLAPLDMRTTTFEPRGETAAGYVGGARAPVIANGSAEAAGGLWSSANDLTKWVRFQLAAWPPRDEPERGPLRRSSVRESHLPHLTTDLVTEDGGAPRSRAMGLGWKTERTCTYAHLVEHGGDLGGYRVRIWFAPDRGFGFVLLANASDAPLDALATRLLGEVAASGALEPREDPSPRPPTLPPPPTPPRCVP